MTKTLYCTMKEKMPSRERLLGWLAGYYWAMANKLGIDIKISGLNRRSRESLYRLYLKITKDGAI